MVSWYFDAIPEPDTIAFRRHLSYTLETSFAIVVFSSRAQERIRLDKLLTRDGQRAWRTTNSMTDRKWLRPSLEIRRGDSAYLKGISAGLHFTSQIGAHLPLSCFIHLLTAVMGGVRNTRREPRRPPWTNANLAPKSFAARFLCRRFFEWHPVHPKLPNS
jgi:hypothetical protein